MPHDLTTLRRAERAHYALQCHLYLDGHQKLPGAVCFAADNISEPEWNHAALLELTPETLDDGLAEIRTFYAARGLPPSLAVAPWSAPRDLPERLAARGFAPSFRHNWFFYQVAEAAVDEAAGVVIERVRTRGELDAALDVFRAVYENMGEPLEEGYARAFERSFDETSAEIEAAHYLAWVDGEPVGVATALHGPPDDSESEARGASGLYNLAVLESFRRRGVGTALTARRAVDTRSRGHDLVFLQTEREVIERWQGRRGLTAGFSTVGYTAA